MGQYLCKACKGVMVETVVLEDGTTAVDEEYPFEFENDALGDYAQCPKCGAKHVVVEAPGPGSAPCSRIMELR